MSSALSIDIAKVSTKHKILSANDLHKMDVKNFSW